MTIKNITKKLVDAGYSEEKLILMTEKEIREVYKNYKSSPKEDDSILSSPNTTPENNDNANKEETTMKNEMIKEMKELARKYDAFTHCIDDCRQREEAEKRNKVLDTKFVEIANKMGINATANDLYEIISNDYDSFDEAIEAYIKSHDVRVVSATLTQENGELTFVELSPEQKLEISKVLDTQLQDVNYSSWFEEENGIFKLYTAWADEDPTVEEEYYFDDNNKLIKVEVEKEESTMKNNTNTTVTNNSTNNKEVITMTNEMIKVTVKVEGLNEVLTHYGIELICSNPSDADTIAIGQTPSQYRKGIVAVIITQTPSQYRKGIATMTIREDVYKTIEKDLSIVSNNSTTSVESVEKEETTMRTTQELLNDALNISKIQDENYVTNAMLREEYKKLTGNVIGSKKTRPVIIKAIQDELHKEPAKPAPDDAKVLTYKLMHMIGDHALTNRKKGFGTTISAKMLCAFIVEVASSNDPEPIDKLYVPTGKKDKYGKPITMVNPKITEEHKNKCKDVRKWLIDNHYIETVTFKDEKGFVFYTPEYDGNRKDKMYDCTKFQATGKVETTTYRVTKEMNKWYK